MIEVQQGIQGIIGRNKVYKIRSKILGIRINFEEFVDGNFKRMLRIIRVWKYAVAVVG